MGNGAISTATILDGFDSVADVLLWVGVAVWLGLAALLSAASVRDRSRLRIEAEHVAALSWPTGTFVLGTHLTLDGADWAGVAMLAIGAALWARLLVPDLRRVKRPAPGSVFLGASATFCFSVLCSVLADAEGVTWLPAVAAGLLVIGLAGYSYALTRFDFTQVLTAMGDHWVAGGALATASFACGELRRASSSLDLLGGLQPTLTTLDYSLWHLAMAALIVLVACELVRPRLGFDPRRWGTVYGCGIAAASSLAVGQVETASWITGFGRVWTWVAFGLWVIVLAATAIRASQALARDVEAPAAG
jgi:tellurite resistance protein TehA-like permease